MKIIDKIKQSTNTLFSFEILPPLKGKSIHSIFNCIDGLMEFSPAFIDVTYHREEYKIKARPDGSHDKVSIRKRPGTVAICASIQNKYKVDAVPHIICGGFTKEDTENALIDLDFLGIENVLALRGDNLKSEYDFKAEVGGHTNSLELIHQLKNMNNGIYLDEDLENPTPTSFCIGAAGYPEKHKDARDMASDLNFLKRKVEAGAEFITTQMFFDNSKYFDYVDKCKASGINVPIIPGIKPLTKAIQLTKLPEFFDIEIPYDLANEVRKATSESAVKQIGKEWCVYQCQELKAKGVPVIHFYTMSIMEDTKAVAREVF